MLSNLALAVRTAAEHDVDLVVNGKVYDKAIVRYAGSVLWPLHKDSWKPDDWDAFALRTLEHGDGLRVKKGA